MTTSPDVVPVSNRAEALRVGRAILDDQGQWEKENGYAGSPPVWDERRVILLGQAAMIAAAPQPPKASVDEVRERVECGCSRCVNEAVRASGGGPSDERLVRYFGCTTCGNKRCPHATDHRLSCTNSNEPGQEGSSYGPPLAILSALSSVDEPAGEVEPVAWRAKLMDEPGWILLSGDPSRDSAWHSVQPLYARPHPEQTGGVVEPCATDALIDRFAEALKAKLRAAEAKYGYNDAWTRDGWQAALAEHLAEHVAKGDPRDVAAYCAFAWHHGWSTAPTDRGWRPSRGAEAKASWEAINRRAIENGEEGGGPWPPVAGQHGWQEDDAVWAIETAFASADAILALPTTKGAQG